MIKIFKSFYKYVTHIIVIICSTKIKCVFLNRFFSENTFLPYDYQAVLKGWFLREKNFLSLTRFFSRKTIMTIKWFYNKAIKYSGSATIPLNSPKRGRTSRKVQFLCCGFWLLVVVMGYSRFKVVLLFDFFLMCLGMVFQSITVLGIKEYFRQFLFVAI